MRKVKRPEGWGKSKALEIAGNLDATIKDQIVELIGDMKISPNTLEMDISNWKRLDPLFREEYDHLISEHRNRPQGGGGKKIMDCEGYEDWWITFLNSLVEFNGNPIQASKAMGGRPSWAYIYRLTNPSDPRYNPHFAMLHEDAMRIVTGKLQGLVLDTLMDDETDPRTKVFGGMQALERLDKANWSKRSEVVVENKVPAQVNVESIEINVAQLGRDMKQLFQENEQAPEKEVIDISPEDKLLEA